MPKNRVWRVNNKGAYHAFMPFETRFFDEINALADKNIRMFEFTTY
jgi:hypothetical protein